MKRFLVASLLALVACSVQAQDNDDCFMCHSEPDMTGERNGREISIYVDVEDYAGSSHADFDCVTCHQDLDGAELPHEDDTEPVECGMCHDEQSEQHAGSLHGEAAARGDEAAPTCADCHGNHDIRSHHDSTSPTAVMNIPLLCGKCHREGSEVSRTHEIHQDRILQNYSMSIHGEGLFKQGLTVTAVCTSCHTSHNILPHTDENSSIHHENVATTCAQCHGQIAEVHRAVIEGRLWRDEPQKIPACVDCHSPHRIRRAFYPTGLANQDCLTCHGKEDLTTRRDGETVSLYVDETAYSVSSHNQTACAQCHTGVTASLERACETQTSSVDCGICHAAQVQEYQGSTHGTLFAAGDADAPACLDCHSNHATQSKRLPSSPTFPRNVPELCAGCHQAGERAAVRIETDIPDIIQGYADSIHGKGLVESGLLVTATCASCHSAHGELPPSDPNSTTHPDNVAHTCGQCHHGIEEQFAESIHSIGEPGEGEKLPTCEDCHSSHTISRTDSPDFRFRMMDQCGRCHEVEAETFFDTFHGKVSRLGSAGAAKCYDCHGTHNILPTADPDSTLNRRNVVETCGNCHPGSHRRFAGYLTHATHHDVEKFPWLFWSFWGMTTLLVGTLSFALIHTLAWLVRLWLSRTLHLCMLISFFTLAITGMIPKFSYMGWAQWVAWMLGGFDTTGTLHRLGAVLLIVIFVVHLLSVRRAKQRSGQTWWTILSGPDSILPQWQDLREVRDSIKWFFGLGPRPRYGRYTYWEKFDYYAVFWGVLIIGSTGMVLWFPELFTYVIPGWFLNVATIIHSDEALLAVGFIFTIHFFNTHFRPDRFPMDPVIFTGRMTLAELKYDKPREYEQRVADGTLEKYLVDPFPRRAERGFKIFGFTALAVGLTLIGLIIYAMLFGYR